MPTAFKAVFFDFNGVLVDDEPLHLELIQRVLREAGLHLSADLCRTHGLGVPDHACLQTLWQLGGRAPLAAHELQHLIERKAAYYLEAVQARDLLFPGVRALVPRLAAALPLALVSGALQQEVEFTLARAELRQHFRVVVTAEDVAQGKPHPAGYLQALTALNEMHKDNLEARECLVIEDSLAGVAAAKRAGMFCVAVTTSFPAAALQAADAIVPSLTNGALEALLHAPLQP